MPVSWSAGSSVVAAEVMTTERIKWRLADHRVMETPRFMRDVVVAVVSLVFSVLFIWYSRNTGHGFFVYWAPFLMAGGALLLGIPVYKRQRQEMSEPPTLRSGSSAEGMS